MKETGTIKGAKQHLNRCFVYGADIQSGQEMYHTTHHTIQGKYIHTIKMKLHTRLGVCAHIHKPIWQLKQTLGN